jgi:O-antigen ligase
MTLNNSWPQRLQLKLLQYTGWAYALFIASIYFSTSLAVIMSAVMGVLWILSGRFKALPVILKSSPVTVWSLILSAYFLYGLSYGNATLKEGLSMVIKYRELLFIPVFISLLAVERHRDWAWHAFFAASFITLAVSYLMYMGVIDDEAPGDFCIKSRITHSIFIAFFSFYCLHKALGKGRFTKLYLALFGLCIYNLFFIVDGRTGQLNALALIILFALQRFSMKGRMHTALVLIAFMGFFLGLSGKAGRINEGILNTQAYLKPQPEQTESSMGLRYSYWKYSLKLVVEKPLAGHGTGSFAKEYQRILDNPLFSTSNPHNEFLMISVQLGIFGLMIYLGFLASQFYGSRALPDKEKWLAQGILLSLIATSLFNTPFFDHTEGHWFAAIIALCFASFQTGHKINRNYA